MKCGVRIAFVLLALVAVGHLLRLALGLEFVVAETTIPMWMSVAAAIVFGGAAFLLWRGSHKTD
jgi:hypothetical protein